MRENTTNHQVCAGLGEVHDLDAVRRLQTGIEPSIDPPVWVGNQWRRRRGRICRQDGNACVYVTGLGSIVVDDDLMESGDDEVDGAAGLYLGHLGDHHMVI